MDPAATDQIRKRMSELSTEDLVAIYVANDRGTYLAATFEVIAEILAERGVEPPPQRVAAAAPNPGGGGPYVVYEHPDGRTERVKNGFSWPAFFFGAIWAWVKGMVLVGFGLLVLALFVSFLSPILFVVMFGGAGLWLDLLFTAAVAIWIGSQGNEWRRRHLVKAGFQPPSGIQPAGS